MSRALYSESGDALRQNHALNVRVNVERRRAQKPTQCLIAFRAKLTARVEGAETAATMGIPAARRFLNDLK